MNLPMGAPAQAGRGGSESPAPAGASPLCLHHPTRRIDLAVNLDPDAALSPRSRFGPPPNVFLSPLDGTPLTIRDPNGLPREIVIHWARLAEHEWLVAVLPPARLPDPLPPRLGFLSANARASASIAFDARGELLGSGEIPILLPPETIEPASGTGSDVSALATSHPLQHLVLRLRSERGATTQYAGPFVEQVVAKDGIICPAAPRLRPACRLSEDLRGDGIGGEGASIAFSAEGILLSSVRERIQGYRVDWATGARDEALSDARLPAQMIPPRATEQLRIVFELPADAVIESEDAFSPSSVTIPVQVFDRVGRLGTLFVQLARVGDTDWRWAISTEQGGSNGALPFVCDPGRAARPVERVPAPIAPLATPESFLLTSSDLPSLEIGSELNGVFTNSPCSPFGLLEGGAGRLHFDEAGTLAAVSQADRWLEPGELAVVRQGIEFRGAPGPGISVDFGVGASRLDAALAVLAIERDGWGPGTPSSARVSRDHVLEVVGSNGVVSPVSELAFAAPGAPHCKLACSNRRDDDRDGLTDFPDDPGCASGFDGTE